MSESGGVGVGHQPELRVVRGRPTPQELAALVVVVAAAAAPAPAAVPAPGRWPDRAALLRRPPQPGPGAWRASALPR